MTADIPAPVYRGGIRGGYRSGRLMGPVRSAGLLIVVVAIFTILNGYFLNATNVSNLLVFAGPGILVAVGQTFVIALGEIDLSVASVAALSGIVFVLSEPAGVLPAFLAALGTGLGAGLFNGVVTALLRVPSLVSSLAMLFIAQGLAFVLSSKPVNGTRLDLTIAFGTQLGPILTVQTTIVLGVVVVAAVVLGLTPLGRALFARGANPKGARSIGLPSRSLVIGAFATSGLLAALAGATTAIALNSASPVVGGDLLLLGIAACLIGGSRLEGGTGSVVGSVLALIGLLALQSGMDQFGVSSYVQQVIQGAVVLIAILASSSTVGGVQLTAVFDRLTGKQERGFTADP